ncbi:hypothetical protein MOV59_000677 [Proteus mirabilis]|nr:hypothetical protein [Proteus mirabilis]EKU7263248.1 hypothetical protein [Proteus mirabilis]EKV5075631.1 hypothetical protein [Proteus mirabilis]ELB1132403.1 hypothetical protein [Proteus mirabilis]MCS4548368.1 hypothetical protein [Proteus mirabilis]
MDLISRLTTNTTRADFALAHQQQLIQLLIQHFSAKYHTLFATPQKTAEDTIEWYGEISGQPVALNALSEQQRQEIRDALDDDLKNLKEQTALLASQQRITDEERHLLDTASTLPDAESIYIINGKPIITWWPRTTPLAPTVAQVTAGSSAAAAGAALAKISPKTRHRWLRWLLVLLLVLIALVSWLRGCFDINTTPSINDTSATAVATHSTSTMTVTTNTTNKQDNLTTNK